MDIMRSHNCFAEKPIIARRRKLIRSDESLGVKYGKRHESIIGDSASMNETAWMVNERLRLDIVGEERYTAKDLCQLFNARSTA